MTDLDTLRRALRAQQPAGQRLDVDEIITRGRRLRWRRRLAVAAGGVCLAGAAAFGVLAGIGHPGGAAPVPAQRPAGPSIPSRPVHEPTPGHGVVSRPPAPIPSPTGSLAPYPAASPSRVASPERSGPIATPSASR